MAARRSGSTAPTIAASRDPLTATPDWPPSRRATASGSRTASSITTTSAPTNPSTTRRFIVTPNRSSTTTAAATAIGMATTAMTAARQENRNSPISRTASAIPIDSVSSRLLIADSTNVAGRYTVGVDPQVAQPGREFPQRRLDTLRDLESVCVRELLDDQHQAVALIDDPVADQQLVVLHDVGHVTQQHAGVALDRNPGKRVRVHDR